MIKSSNNSKTLLIKDKEKQRKKPNRFYFIQIKLKSYKPRQSTKNKTIIRLQKSIRNKLMTLLKFQVKNKTFLSFKRYQKNNSKRSKKILLIVRLLIQIIPNICILQKRKLVFLLFIIWIKKKLRKILKIPSLR